MKNTSKRRNNSKKKNRRNTTRKSNLLDVPHPPQLDANVSITKTFRYRETTPGLTIVTRKDLLNLIVLPDTSTTAYGLLKSCRIRHIRAWCINSTSTMPLGNGISLSLTWLSNLGLEVTKRATQMGVAPAYLSTSPPKDSLAGFWCQESSDPTDILFTLSLPSGSIVDMSFEFIFANTQSPRNFAITSGSVGEVSYNNFASLDVQNYTDYIPA